jgi:hypothetical protein
LDVQLAPQSEHEVEEARPAGACSSSSDAEEEADGGPSHSGHKQKDKDWAALTTWLRMNLHHVGGVRPLSPRCCCCCSAAGGPRRHVLGGVLHWPHARAPARR